MVEHLEVVLNTIPDWDVLQTSMAQVTVPGAGQEVLRSLKLPHVLWLALAQEHGAGKSRTLKCRVQIGEGEEIDLSDMSRRSICEELGIEQSALTGLIQLSVVGCEYSNRAKRCLYKSMSKTVGRYSPSLTVGAPRGLRCGSHIYAPMLALCVHYSGLPDVEYVKRSNLSSGKAMWQEA
eukprot:6489054-Amphidinium_carterae.1